MAIDAFDGITIDAFYGITTTTLIVLSSFTLTIFQWLGASSVKKIESHHNRLLEYSDNDGNLTYECIDAIKYDLVGKHDKLQNDFKQMSQPLEGESIVLLIVVFISAISIFLVLLHGVCQFDWITPKVILDLNLFAIVIYLLAFVTFVIRRFKRRKKITQYGIDIRSFLTKITIADGLNKK